MAQKTVMIVDDDNDLLCELADALAASGYRVLECDDAGTAPRLAAEERPDVILIDVVMPAMNGSEVVDRLRAEGVSSRTPIVVMSGCNDREGETLARVNGLAGFLPKPINMARLLSLLREVA